MKTTLLSIFFCFSYFFIRGQETQVLYFDRNDRQVNGIHDAFIIREIKKTGAEIFSFSDFYTSNKKLKLTGSGYFFNNRIIYHGDFKVYNENSVKIQEFSFEYGKSKGLITEYFNNGILFRKSEKISVGEGYDFDRAGGDVNELPNFGHDLFKLNYLADSTGKTLIENGKGYLIERLNYLGEYYTEEGNYVDGFKDGVWKGKNSSGTKLYLEHYKKGILKRGELTTAGKKISYSKLFTAPNYKYTNNHIADLYLMDTQFYKKYVPTIKKYELGDSRILVHLTINENGNVTSVVFDYVFTNQQVKSDLTEALMNMPKWKPATLRGQNVKAKYSCTLPFFKTME